MIVLWEGRGVATEGTPYENAYAFFMRMCDGEVDMSSYNELWDRVKRGER